MNHLLLHLGYILMLIALAVRDILWLRSILIGAQVSLICYALLQGNHVVAFWNFVFIGINTIQVLRIIRERKPIKIGEELIDLYKGTFSSMTTREFLFFWGMGQIKEDKDGLLISQGETQQELLLLLSGTVDVVKDGMAIAQLSRGHFISEMSLITGEPASATISYSGEITFIAWNREKLDNLEKLNPQLSIKIQGILSKDLVNKIKSASTGEHNLVKK